MNRKFLFLVATLVIAIGGSSVAASFWDSIPLISQIKSKVQAACGDEAGAEQTKVNFLNQAPIVSQVKSIVESASGDEPAAVRTQKQFLQGFVEPIVDNTPGIGHLKGKIHIMAGDTERGEQIIKGATANTAALFGTIVAGPVGGIAAKTAMEGVITGLDSARNQKYSPYGIIDYASNIDKQSPGEHVDQILNIGAGFAKDSAVDKVADPMLQTNDLSFAGKVSID